MYSRLGGGVGRGILGRQGMIQIAPQRRIRVANRAMDGSKGADSLAVLYQKRLPKAPATVLSHS